MKDNLYGVRMQCEIFARKDTAIIDLLEAALVDFRKKVDQLRRDAHADTERGVEPEEMTYLKEGSKEFEVRFGYGTELYVVNLKEDE